MDGSASHNMSKVHMMPCNIAFDGPTEIDDYFHPITSGTGSMSARFRGRNLKGEKVDIPSHRTGLYVRASKTGPTEINGIFDNIIVWEHDLDPDRAAVSSAMDWFDVADAIHSDIPEAPSRLST